MKDNFNPRKIIWGGILFLHPTVMSVEQVIMLVCELEKDDYVAKAAAAIRKVVQCLKDVWPPQPSGLESEKFKIPSKANKFFTCLLIVTGENETSSRSARPDIL